MNNKYISAEKKAERRKNLICFIACVLIWIILLLIAVFAEGKEVKQNAEISELKQEIAERNEAELPQVYGRDGKLIEKDLFFAYSSEEFEPIPCDLPEELQEYTYNICKAYYIDFYFLMAVMQTESGFDVDCESETGDIGLMQINKVNHKWLSEELGITDFHNPYQSIKAGAYIFRGLFEKYDTAEAVLMAYNHGQTGAAGLWEQGIYRTAYTDKVIEAMEALKND